MARRVCVVTGSRAEYGLLYWVLRELRDDPAFALQLVVTGMHLAAEFGHTVDAIEQDGFAIAKRVEMLVAGDTPAATARVDRARGRRHERRDRAAHARDRHRPRRPLRDLRSGAGVPRPQRAARAHRRRRHHRRRDRRSDAPRDHEDGARPLRDQCGVGAAPAPARRRPGADPRRRQPGLDHLRRTLLLDRAALEAELDSRLGKRNVLVTFHP
jgi:hypothetical protein